jgi:RNA polymerase sigma factor (sigma-70 family)
VNSWTDQQLIRDYTGSRSEPAFAELARRHVDFVYSAALRLVRDTHLAEDVTQAVFVALAQNASELTDRPALSGWLHRTTQNLAANAVRSDVRRRAREQEAAVMHEILSAEPDAGWEQIAPQLDAALGELSEGDREALLLRYFERKSAGEMAQTLGISDEAAQKRVNRAVERLRELFAKRGVAVGASGLVAGISANAVQAAPAGLVAIVSTSAALGGTTLVTTATATKVLAMTALQKTLVTALITAAVGTGIYEARQASTLRSQVQTLQQQQAPLADQLTALQTENERLSNQVAQPKDSHTLSQAQSNELLKLRSKATLAQADSRELARLKATAAQQTGQIPDYFTNAMARGLATANKWKQKDALARLARMKTMLNLSADQEQAISNVMTNQIQRQSQMTLDAMMGKLTPEQAKAQAGPLGDEQAEIKALLTPEQLAAYPGYVQAEKTTAANNSAASEASQIAANFSLPKDQQETLRALLYEMNLKEPENALNQQAITQAGRSGKIADAVSMSVELQKQQLEDKLKILAGFLSPEQMATYRQEQTDRISTMASALKMFPAQKSAAETN